MNKPTIIFAIIAAAFYLPLQAQTDLPSEQVEVIKVFEAQLAETEKVPVTPELPPIDTTIKRQEYQVPPKSINVDYPAPRIRPITHKSDEDIPEVYKFYGKLGAGLPKAILGEGAFHTRVERNDKSSYDIGLNLFHHSADFSSDNVENQRFGLTKAGGQGTYYFEQGFAVRSKLAYTSNRVSYYGYNFDPFFDRGPLDKDAVKQLFGIFDFGANIFNGVQTAGDFNYNAGVDFYSMGDQFAANETGFALNGKATKWFGGKHSLDIGLITDFTWYNDTLLEKETLHNFTLHPAFTFHANAIKVKIGGKVVSHDDEFFPFPDIEAVINLTGNELAFYVGLEGDLQKNTFRSLTTYNPYLHTRLEQGTLRNTKYFNAFAGIRGNLKYFEYTAQVGYKPTNDLALYIFRFDSDNIYDFDVIYDDVNIVNISGSLKAVPLKNLTVTGTISQSFFDNTREFRSWHIPSFQANLKAQYVTLDGKLTGKAQLFLENGVPANRIGGVNRWDNLGSLYDLSAGGEYWFVKNFGAFLEVNNILNNKRERWRYYPIYGINVLAGITARF